MKFLAIVLLLAACGSSQPETTTPTTDPDPPGVVADTRTELERRRDTACDTLVPRLTQCAVDDAKAELEAGRITQAKYNEITASGVQAKNSDEAEKECKVELSSRQVRVLEVCQTAETECDPLIACLGNLNASE
jgi:hypothetical protein